MCEGESDALEMLGDPEVGGDAVNIGGSSSGDGDGGDSGGKSCSLTLMLIHIPASVLYHSGQLLFTINESLSIFSMKYIY